jgi:hypothetical protein
LQASLPGQEAVRFHAAPSGFDRAVAVGRVVSPHQLLALRLAHLQQPADAFRHAEASLARGVLDDLASDSPAKARQAASLRSRLDRLDQQLVPLFGLATVSTDQNALRDELVRQRRETLADLARLAANISARLLLPLADIQKQLADDAALLLWLDGGKLAQSRACIVRAGVSPSGCRCPAAALAAPGPPTTATWPIAFTACCNNPPPATTNGST